MWLLDTSVCIPLINRTDRALANRLLANSPGSVGANDLMIASIALAGPVRFVTRNWDEFSRVPGLEVDLW